MTFRRNIEIFLVGKLAKQHKTISVAESCTGGALANCITNVSGSSKVFLGGVVAYSNQLKEKLLGVDPAIIRKHGAVSKECVVAMVKGLYRLTRADICVAITGIAGPTGRTKKKPVGTVFVTYLMNGRVEIEKYVIRKERKKFKDEVCRKVIIKLLRSF